MIMLAGCATPATQIASNEATCAAIKHSPKYSGKKLEAATGKPFHGWVRTTNLTLDNLGCHD